MPINPATVRASLLALGLSLALLTHGTSIAADMGIESNVAAVPAPNEQSPRPGEGFVWPPGYWDGGHEPAPASLQSSEEQAYSK